MKKKLLFQSRGGGSSSAATTTTILLSAQLLLVLSFLCGQSSAQPYAAFNLRTEYLPSPVYGLDVPQPRFSWNVQGPDRGVYQSAFQIWVSMMPDVPAGDVWDSGVVQSANNTLVSYAGNALSSDTTYYWKVIWWDSNNDQAPASEVFQFDTGFYATSDWTASWIGGYNQLRQVFTVENIEVVSRARAFICGIGYYELYINGLKVGNNLLDPGWTHYSYRSLYVVYDVTDYLTQGDNVVGVLLGNGWYGQGWNGPKSLLFQLNIRNSTNGLIQSVVSDDTWSGTQGPIIMDSIYNGETYDARLEQDSWNTINFSNSSWGSAQLIDGPGGILSAQMIPPIQIVESLKPISITEVAVNDTTAYVFDFGQNFSGWCRINVTGEAGTTVVLRHGEILQSDGQIYTLNLRSALATDTYIMKGDPNGETYEPRFTYHGFRFVQLTGYPGVPDESTLEAFHLTSTVSRAGSIEFPVQILNTIQHNILWGQSSNLMSVPTDCDQRDERLGWMADAQLSSEEAFHNFDMGAFYTHWLRLIQDEQENGTVPDVVPFTRYGGRPADPAWGAAYPLLVYWMWEYYGDQQLLAAYYPGVKAYIDDLNNRVQSTGLSNMYAYYGDWVPPPPQPKCSESLTSAFYFLLNMRQLITMATALGNTDDASYYMGLYDSYTAAFNDAWLNNDIYDIGVQTAMALPMTLRIVPEENYQGVMNNFLNDIVSTNDYHLTTGILGTKYLMDHLDDLDRNDIAIRLAQQATYPSWGWMIKQNLETSATTLWELWDAPLEGPGMNSRNHIMFGSVGSWYYKTLGGIRQKNPATQGFKQIVIKPPSSSAIMNSAITSVSASYQTIQGLVKSSWSKQGGAICGEAVENDTLTITCGENGGVILSVIFADYGTPVGQCGAYSSNATCTTPGAFNIANQECINQNSCSFTASSDFFSNNPCGDIKKFAVQVQCSNPTSFSLATTIPGNTQAEITVPLLDMSETTITESGTTVWQNGQYVSGASGITGASMGNNSVVFYAGSGNYSFVAKGLVSDVICGAANQSEVVKLVCPAAYQTIALIRFASYGNPTGGCGGFAFGSCNAGSSFAMVESACLGENVCSVSVSDSVFGTPSCSNGSSSLAIEAICSTN